MKSLSELLKNLESKAEVDAAFLTGSHGTASASADSDIDLVIILTANKTNIRSVYEKIDGVFADIFFFDKYELEKLLYQKEVDGNSFDGMLVRWIEKSDIKFDKSGLLTRLKAKVPEIKLIVTEHERNSVLNKISYNFIQNQRYFKTDDAIYHEALEIRLMYSVVELLAGFLALRNEPWRGEKHAVEFIKEKMPEFYALFAEYKKAAGLEERMRVYTEMVSKVLPENMNLFDYDTPLALPRDNNTSQEIERQRRFWDEITTG